MSIPSEKLLDANPLYTPSQAYRRLLHSARDADRLHISTRHSNVQFESYEAYQDDEPYEDVDLEKLLQDLDESAPEDVDLDKIFADIDASAERAVEVEVESSETSIPLDEGELLEDSYVPGYLDDLVNGKVPPMKGLSLLEAFESRMENELKELRDRLGMAETSAELDVSGLADLSGASGVLGVSGASGVSGTSGVSDASRVSGVSGVSRVSAASAVSGVPGVAEVSTASEVGMDSSVREEDVMAALLGVKIDRKIRNKTETELTKAIDGLVNIELMHEYHLKFDVMQRMSRQVVGQLMSEKDKETSAAAGSPIGKKYPKFDVINVGDEETGRPLEIVTYIGSTRSRIEK